METVGGTCVWTSEWDKHAAATYEKNYGDRPHGDITRIPAEEIPSHDMICAGFPCQPFSVSGKQLGFEDTRGTLFFDIARIAKYHQPKILFLENVANLNQHGDGETVKRMTETLDTLGYDVNYRVLNASDYGVPQARKRLYFLCFRKDLGITDYQYPEPLNIDVALEDILLPDSETEKYLIHEPVTFTRNDTPDRVNKPIRIGTIGKGGQGNRVYSPRGHAITLSAQGGGNGAKTGAYLVNGKVRKLAPEECRRVQGFPAGFILVGSDFQQWKQFGNSVAVPVLTALAGTLTELPPFAAIVEESQTTALRGDFLRNFR